VNRTRWTTDEDRLLLTKYRELGPRWTVIRQFFNNRSVNNVKNRWNSVTRKIRALALNERSERDFLHCARLITPQDPADELELPEAEARAEDEVPDPEAFFQITNLLNHPTTEIGEAVTLC
jgi:hypothetical protein